VATVAGVLVAGAGVGSLPQAASNRTAISEIPSQLLRVERRCDIVFLLDLLNDFGASQLTELQSL
jgi:hypothetical protein